MKPVTTMAVTMAILVAACAILEDRIARFAPPEVTAAALDAGCSGGREFIEAATAGLDSPAIAVILQGVQTACALRAERRPVSSVIYDAPLDNFCAQTNTLMKGEARAKVREAFNKSHGRICGGRP